MNEKRTASIILLILQHIFHAFHPMFCSTQFFALFLSLRFFQLLIFVLNLFFNFTPKFLSLIWCLTISWITSSNEMWSSRLEILFKYILATQFRLLNVKLKAESSNEMALLNKWMWRRSWWKRVTRWTYFRLHNYCYSAEWYDFI